MAMNVYTEYAVEINWESMTEIIHKHDFGYFERALKELCIWCDAHFPDENRWRHHSTQWPNSDIFSFRNETDRTLFLLKWS